MASKSDTPSKQPPLSTLQSPDTNYRNLVKALKAEIKKLQNKNAKLEAQHISDKFRISALEKQNKKLEEEEGKRKAEAAKGPPIIYTYPSALEKEPTAT